MIKPTLLKPIRSIMLATILASLLVTPGCATKIPLPKLPEFGKLPSPPQLNRIPPIPQLAALFKKRQDRKTSEQLRLDTINKLPITHPLRKEAFFEVWNTISERTKIVPLSDRRYRISTKNEFIFQGRTPLLAGENITEQYFFIRAAAETIRAGYDGFAVVHIDYYSPGIKLVSLAPNYSFSSQRWIGTYEDFLQNKNEQNMFSSRRSKENKVMDGIIIMLNAEDRPTRDRFSAKEIYLNLITHQAK